MIPITAIRRDGGTQPRDHISIDVVKDYAEAIVDGAILPPVTVFYDGTEYWLADGFHRVEARLILHGEGLLKSAEIDADVRQGNRRDAVLFSVGANASHGYRRSNADKRRAVQTLINDPEWSGWSNREIARRCAVDDKTVGNLRPPVSAELPQIARTVKRGDAVYPMDVQPIGRKPRALPIIAGKQAERRPRLDAAGLQEEISVSFASAITGLSERNVKALAAEGKIDGAVKDGGRWLMPTASVVALVVPAVEAPTPTPAAYDPEKGNLRLAISDTVELIASWPAPSEALAAWAESIGGAPDNQTFAKAGQWMAEFAAGWPEVARARADRARQLQQENLDHVA